jgi:sialidase-1
VTDGQGYHVMNNARVVRLSTGRLVAPVARCQDAGGPDDGAGHFRSACYLSDDEGRTWRAPSAWVDLTKRGAMEPAVVERKDGSLLMILRTQFGHVYRVDSSDGGETWGNPRPTQLLSPDAPASVARVPTTGDLLAIWNDNYDLGISMGGRRTPLRSTISNDDGIMWLRYRTLEKDIHGGYAYTSISFAGEETLLTYYDEDSSGRVTLRFRAVPTGWFYELEDAGLKDYISAGGRENA